MNKYLRFLPALIWMAVIFYFSGQPTDAVPGTGFERFLLFKSLHLIEYALLYVLIFFGFRRSAPSAIASYLYAVTDEFHQTFTPGRSGQFSDTLIDLFGIILGIAALRTLMRFPQISRLLNDHPASQKQN